MAKLTAGYIITGYTSQLYEGKTVIAYCTHCHDFENEADECAQRALAQFTKKKTLPYFWRKGRPSWGQHE